MPTRLLLVLAYLTSMAAAAQPTLFILSDATARNAGTGKNGQEMAGWGTALAAYFDSARVGIRNAAAAGHSSRTFFNHPDLWPVILAEIKAGDFVLIGFGHHDSGPPYMYSSPGSLPGLGAETKDLPRPDGTVEKAHTFGWYMATMATHARDKGAHVVFLTVTARNIWTNPKARFRDGVPTSPLPADYDPREDRIERGKFDGEFVRWTWELGGKLGVPVLDVTNLCADRFEQLGREVVRRYFSDHNHTNEAGADAVAAAIVSGLKAFPRSPFVPLLSAKGAAVPVADAKYAEANE